MRMRRTFRRLLSIIAAAILCHNPVAASELRNGRAVPGQAATLDFAVSNSVRSRHRLELTGFDRRAQPLLVVLDPAQRLVASGKAGVDGRLVLDINATPGQRLTAIVVALGGRSSAATLRIDGAERGEPMSFGQATQMTLRASRSGRWIVARQASDNRHLMVALDGHGRPFVAHFGSTTAAYLPGGRGNVILLAGLQSGRPIDWDELPDDDGDIDNDGLSDIHERRIRTCVTRSDRYGAFRCATVRDMRDTDGDGLMDSWEVLGFNPASHNLPGPFLPLPSWGADPRHKDIFIEIDFRRLDKAENDMALDLRMTAMNARGMAALYADAITTDPALRALHAASAGNPDGKPGVNLHLDTGVAPETAADAKIYGDWGGHNPVDAVPDPARPGEYLPQTPAIWTSQMTRGRHGIFHYVLGYNSGGGACGLYVACGFNFGSIYNSAHEFGHSLGLHHYGPAGVNEPNCKPNYPSLMNYAGFSQFSDGRDLGVLNDNSLVETGGVGQNPELIASLRTTFGYKVDEATGSVDWDRNNVFAGPGTKVRANANFVPGGGCETTRDNERPTGMLSKRAPAIVDLGGHLYVFSISDQNQLVSVNTPTAFRCGNVDDCPELAFHQPFVQGHGPVSGIDAARVVIGGRQMIMIVGIRPDGRLFQSSMEYRDGRYYWSGPLDLPASNAAGEPSLAVSRDGLRIVLAYKGQDHHLRFRRWTPSGFEPERLAKFNGQPIAIAPQASPAIAFTQLPLPTDITPFPQERLLGAFPDAAIRLLMPTTGDNWTNLAIPYARMPTMTGSMVTRVTGRPSLAWVAPADPVFSSDGGRIGSSTTGRLYIVYMLEEPPRYPEPKPDPLRMAMSYVDTSGRLRIGLDSYFDNIWAFAYGVDLLQPGQIALRAATTYSIRNSDQQVYVRPHADGIINFPYRNYDDWPVIAWGSCQTIREFQPITPKIGCAPKSW